MSRRRRDSQSRRGEHKKAASPEARRWERDYLIPGPPSWMTVEDYRQLAELRKRLP